MPSKKSAHKGALQGPDPWGQKWAGSCVMAYVTSGVQPVKTRASPDLGPLRHLFRSDGHGCDAGYRAFVELGFCGACERNNTGTSLPGRCQP